MISGRVNIMAFVIKSTDYGESDRIITLLTKEIGKVRAIAKGARRSLKRFGGCLEQFSIIDAVLQPREGLSVLIEGRVARDFKSIRSDIDKIGYGSYLLELADSMPGADFSGEKGAVFGFLNDGLESLEASRDPEPVAREFEMRILGLTGYLPSLITCASCGKKIDKEYAEGGVPFSLEMGGALCKGCLNLKGSSVLRVSMGTLKTLNAAAGGNVSFSKNALAESSEIIPPFITHHLGMKFKSLDFIRKMKGL